MARRIADSQVYAATIETLLERGYAGATTRLIATRAGINEATLFRKYGSKAKLISAAVSHERAQLEVDDIAFTGNVKADLLQIVRLYYGAALRQSQLMLLIMSEMARHPELRQTLQVPYRLVTRFGRLMTRYQEEGVLRTGEPVLMVGALLGPVIINAMLLSSDPGLEVPPLDPEEHVRGFLNGYRRSS